MAEDKTTDKAPIDPLDEMDADSGSGTLGGILKLLLPVGIVIVFAGAGHFVSRLTADGPAEIQPAGSEDAPGDQPASTPKDGSGQKPQPDPADAELEHHDLESITINPNEPQVTRYLQVVFSLAINKEDYSDAKTTIETKSNEIKNWLITYLCDLSLDDVRGARNINRVRREVQDLLNNRLWPEGKPLIVNVSLKEWLVQ